jgi:hypothetical protein
MSNREPPPDISTLKGILLLGLMLMAGAIMFVFFYL